MTPETELWNQDQGQIAGVELLFPIKDWERQVVKRSYIWTACVKGGCIQSELKKSGN